MTSSEMIQAMSLSDLKSIHSVLEMLCMASVTDIARIERTLADELMRREHDEPTPGAEKEV